MFINAYAGYNAGQRAKANIGLIIRKRVNSKVYSIDGGWPAVGKAGYVVTKSAH